jgi:hypothetical protein
MPVATVDAVRARALRAARAVTLGFALTSAGCAASVTPLDDAGATASDALAASSDTALADSASDADAIEHCNAANTTDWEACCDRNQWSARSGCLAWGPLAPPGIDALDAVPDVTA